MKLTNERIFAKDTDMMFWQQDNCTQCAKAVWYNARLGRCPRRNRCHRGQIHPTSNV